MRNSSFIEYAPSTGAGMNCVTFGRAGHTEHEEDGAERLRHDYKLR